MRGSGAAALALGLALAASGASAKIVTATFTGHTGNGFDIEGLFGPAGWTISNQPYTAVYTWDTTVAANTTRVAGLATEVDGGSFFGVPGQAVSATLTINGVTKPFAGDLKSQVIQLTLPSSIAQVAWVVASDNATPDYELNTELFIHFDSYVNAFTATEDPTVPAVYTFAQGDFTVGDFKWFEHDYRHGITLNAAQTDLYVDRITVTTAVPEPGAWLTLLAGTFGVGAAARRRRESVGTRRA